MNITDNIITCTSIHLTSFAVLVDIAGAHMVHMYIVVYIVMYFGIQTYSSALAK